MNIFYFTFKKEIFHNLKYWNTSQQHYHIYIFNQEINISYELAYNFKGFHGEMTVR